MSKFLIFFFKKPINDYENNEKTTKNVIYINDMNTT